MTFKDIKDNPNIVASLKGKDIIALDCDSCNRSFELSKRSLQSKLWASKIDKCFCSRDCSSKGTALAKRKPIIVQCSNCDKDIVKNPVLFSRCKTGIFSCSERCKAANRKKFRPRTCTKCTIKYFYEDGVNSKRRCSDCLDKDTDYKSLTIEEYASLVPNMANRIRSRISGFCRSWNSHLENESCQRCGYSTIIEFAHIKAVSLFDKKTATLGEINDENNVLILCPTHHAEFDRGILTIDQIHPRVARTLNPLPNNHIPVHDSTDTHEPSQSYKVQQE